MHNYSSLPVVAGLNKSVLVLPLDALIQHVNISTTKYIYTHTHPGNKEELCTKLVQPVIQEVEKKRLHVVSFAEGKMK